MMILVRDIDPEISQSITLKLQSRYILKSIAPYLVMVGAPSGTFTFQLKSGLITLFEQSFTSAELKAALNTTNNNAYVYYPFLINKRLKKGTYTLKITASGYSPASSSFIGWAQQHEDIQNQMEYLPSNDGENSLAFRMKIVKEGVL